MFEMMADPKKEKLWSFWVQECLVFLGSLVLGGMLIGWVADISRPIIGAYSGLFGTIASLLTAFVTGYRIQRAWPWTYRTGRVIWILPLFLLLLALCIDLATSGEPLVDTLSGYFYPRPGKEDLLAFLITWPTVCCFLYSAGMFTGHRRSAERDSNPPINC